MKIVKWVILGIAILFALFLLVTAFLPTEYEMSRSIRIEARPGIIYNQVADLRAWQEWNPWNTKDPSIEITYGEKQIGAGASYRWEGETSGSGRMEIIEAHPPLLITYRLEFGGYEKTPSTSKILLTPDPQGGPTEVTWSFEGSVGDQFFARWMSVMIDSLVGKSYEEGLQALKKRAEKVEEATLGPVEPVRE